MEGDHQQHLGSGTVSSCFPKFDAKSLARMARAAKKLGEEDPRRIIHSFKVGLALTLISVFYYVNHLYAGFGAAAMWAVLTVVVVMEFTVGGTLSRGMNRSAATLVAGGLGLGAHHVADLCGVKGEPVVLAILVFILATAATYSRFLPEVKAKYDHGVVVFIMTFSLIAVSSYRTVELTHYAIQRLSTTAMGVAICICTSIFVLPVWAGAELHGLVAAHLERLASFLEGIGEEYFGYEKVGKKEDSDGKGFFQAYKSVLTSKPLEDSLANFALWEPSHGNFGFRHPWKQYLKIAALCRQCAQSMATLENYIDTSKEIEKTSRPEICDIIRSACMNMSVESSNALTELALALKTTRSPSSTNQHLDAALAAADDLKVALSDEAGGSEVRMVLKQAVVFSLLVDVVHCVHQIAESVQELSQGSKFKIFKAVHKSSKVKTAGCDGCEVVNVVVV